MAAAEKLLHSFAEYMALEAETGEKFEYYDGYPVAMAGGAPLHSQIAANTITAISVALRDGCIAYTSDARVAIEADNSYLYPDAAVVCGPLQTAAGQSIANPSVLVEVLSDSTAGYDRGEKFRLYRRIPSLRHYVLVSQKSALVEVYHRTDDGAWLLTEAEGLDKSMPLPALSMELKLSDIYRNVVFEPIVRGRGLLDKL